LSQPWRQVADGLELSLKLTPNASRAAIIGVTEGYLRVSVSAAPTDGQANEALLRFLAKSLRVPFSSISVLRGHSARQKVVLLAGDGVDLKARLAALVKQD
jgi:uncharacterized protein